MVAGVLQQRLHRIDELVVFGRRQFHDLAAGILDDLARLRVFLFRQLALIGHRFDHRRLHRLLQIDGPAFE